MKKYLSLVLAIVMLVCLFPLTAVVSGATEGPNTSNGSMLVTGRTFRTSGPTQYIADKIVENGDGSYYMSAWFRLTQQPEQTVYVQLGAQYTKNGNNSWANGAYLAINDTEWHQLEMSRSLSSTSTYTDFFIYVHTVTDISTSAVFKGDYEVDELYFYKMNVDGTKGEQLIENPEFIPHSLTGETEGWSVYGTATLTNTYAFTQPNTDNGSVIVSERTSRTSGPRQEILDIIKANGVGQYCITGWMRLVGAEAQGVDLQMIGEYKDTSVHWPGSSFQRVYDNTWTRYTFNVTISDVDALSYFFITVHTLYAFEGTYDERAYKGDIECDDFGLYKKNDDGTWSEQLLLNGEFAPNEIGGVDDWSVNQGAKLTNTKGVQRDFTSGVKDSLGNITYSKGFVPITDENIIYSGRWTDQGDGTIRASFEGYVEINFTGTSLYVIDPTGKGYVEIDDSGEYTNYSFGTSVKIAEGLEYGQHKVRIYTQAQLSGLTVGGFYVELGEKTIKTDDGPIIEFIGDSIMEGYTVDDADRTITSNSYLNSYGFLVGKKLSEEYGFRFHNVAFGGIGLANYSDPLNIGGRYFKEREYVKSVDESTVPYWDTSKLVPDYIVINIGTNDYNKNQAEAKANYISFINDLYEAYPNVKIVVMLPFNSSATHNNDNIVATIKDVVSQFDSIILLDSYEWDIEPGADGLHPSIQTHKKVATKLYGELVSKLKFAPLGKMFAGYYTDETQTEISATATDHVRYIDKNVLKTVASYKHTDSGLQLRFMSTLDADVYSDYGILMKYNGQEITYSFLSEGNKKLVAGTTLVGTDGKALITQDNINTYFSEESTYAFGVAKIFAMKNWGKSITIIPFAVTHDGTRIEGEAYNTSVLTIVDKIINAG